jgi:multimeric flavodoxin WrbA
MTMNIVAILGSPHGMKGNTGTLLAEVIRGAEQAGAKVDTHPLADLDVRPCRACDACHKTGQCSIRDDHPKLKAAIEAADGIVLASPNYLVSVSAQMKAMMDRLCGPLHCQAYDGKYGAAVVTSGGGGSEEVERYLLRFLHTLGCWTVGSVGADRSQLTDPATRSACFAAAADLGRRLVEAIQEKATFPDQLAERSAFAARMHGLVTAMKDAWPFEYQYWKSRGRL